MRDQFAAALVTSIDRDELLRALRVVIDGLLAEGIGGPDWSERVTAQLRSLPAHWGDNNAQPPG